MTVEIATTAAEIAELAIARRAYLIEDNKRWEDEVSAKLYNAYSSVSVWVKDENTVVANIADQYAERFDYILGYVLDVDTCEEIFTNGRIETSRQGTYLFILDAR